MLISFVDVSPEIVGIIAHHLVCDGIREAWKLRGICATFEQAITDDILLRRSRDFLQNGRRILHHIMPRYLFYRVENRLDVHDPLPAKISVMNSYLCQELNITGYKLRNDNLYALCMGQVQILGYVQVERLLWHGSQALFEQEITPGDLTLHEQVIAAISVRSYQLMRTLLPKLTAYRFRFDARSPLVAAVAIKDDEMLKLALGHIPSTKAQNARLTMKDLNLQLAINLAIQQLSVERTIILLEYVQAHKLNGVKDLYHESLKYAVKFSVKPDLKVVRSILEHCPGGQKVIPDIFLHACKSGNIELVRVLLSHMDLDKGTVSTLPLHQAIKSGDAAIIGAVLDAGADINNTNYVKTTKRSAHNEPKSPLEFAITQKFKAVEALVGRGAIVPPLEKWHDAGKTVYTALRSARIAQTGEKVPTYQEAQEKRRMESRRL